MANNISTCPHCKNYVEGKRRSSTKRKVTRTVSKALVKDGSRDLVTFGSTAAGMATGAAIGSVVPVIGTTIGAGIGAIAGYVGKALANDAIGKKVDQAADYLEDEFTEVVYQFSCPRCGHTWTSEEEYYEEDCDDEEDYEDDDTEYETCPNCESDDVEDDGSGFYQYTCNDCGHEWGDIDNEECPQCGSYDCEDDGTGELQFYCKECGHVWGDYDEDEENEEYISSNNQNRSKRSQILDVIKTCSKNSTWLDESCGIDNVYIDKCKSSLQRHYYLDVSTKEISSCKTIGKLIDLIESKLY